MGNGDVSLQPARAGRRDRAISRTFAAFLFAAVVLPVAVLGIVAALDWRNTWRAAERELLRSADAAAQYSLRVLDAHRLAADRVNDLLRGLSDAEIRAREKELHDQLRALIPSLPLVQTVAVLDRGGFLLLTANVYPVPRNRDFRDREWVRDLARPGAPETHISKINIGRLDGYLFFGVSRRRSGSSNDLPPGAFDGVINVSVQPNQVSTGFGDFIGDPGDVVSLLRVDGELLARRPALSEPPQTIPNSGSGLLAAIASGGERITSRGVSPVDGVDRLTAARRLKDYPVYAVVARNAATITGQWRERVLLQLAFGMPALLLLWTLAVLAFQNARKASRARAALAREAVRRAAAEAAGAAEANFRAVFESSVIGMAILDTRSGAIAVVNDALLAMTGHSRADFASGRWSWFAATAPEFYCRDELALVHARNSGTWEPYEKELASADGKRLPVRVSASPLPGRPGHMVLLVQDISKQREAEARRELMMREVEHRTKNMMAVVQSTLRVGASTETNAKALAEAIGGRINALMRAQHLLSQSQWLHADLETLLANELEAFRQGRDRDRERIHLQGPRIELSAAAAQALTMVVHELATNAAKYGALSAPDGLVLVRWSRGADDVLKLLWTERNGPKVQPPERKGFGSRLIEATIQNQLGGTVSKRWHGDGLVCELSIPGGGALIKLPQPGDIEAAAANVGGIAPSAR
ncbi:MAG TPA: HWE histidine kinase domain-containing protein [Alphaproteobacteria bacterium]|nr:HWE histidine kinase domain-containing protein [Alphaproteobacteria bacterium]